MSSESRLVNILIVDDKIQNLVALESLLKDEVTRIYRAQSGDEALELLLKHNFALALLDVQMPNMNGFELAELMRLKDKTKSIPIIFVTAGAIDPKHTFKGYEAGAVDFLYKPLDTRIVRSKVKIFRELEQKRIEVFEQSERLAKSLQAREEFISIASHEIKTPITSLQLQLQVMRRSLNSVDTDPFQKKLGSGLDNSLRQIKKLNILIDDMLDVSRIRGEKLYVQLEQVDLTLLVKQTVEHLSDQITHAKCPISIHAPEPILLQCDAFRTEQVLTNLITNVIKYAPQSSCTINVTQKDREAILSVSDNGPGIKAEKLPLIFERFERIDNTRAVSGLGLGLYIARQIMEAQGGRLEVESVENQGTTFNAYFPLNH